MIWNIPNILTVLRLIAAPGVALCFAMFSRPGADWIALALFAGASVTDWFDGYLARKWHQQSRFGTMLDPIADKAMVITALTVVIALSGLDPWLLIPGSVILFREVFVSGLREFLGADAGRLKVTKLAKWKTMSQMVAIAVLLASFGLHATDPQSGAVVGVVGTVLFWAAGILTAITGVDYFRKALPFLKEDAGS